MQRHKFNFAMMIAVGAGCAAGVASQARADLIDISVPGTTLQQVLGNQFLVGDKLFTVPANGFQSVFFNASQVFITPIVNANPLTGQGFRLSGAFLDAPGGGATDFVLMYKIEVTAPFIAQGYRINDADLRFNGNATGPGSYARVDETLLNSNNNILVNKSVYALGTGEQHLDDHSFITGFTTLNIVKDVQFFANGANGTATASFVDQSFSQLIIPLPTGAALGMLGLGLASAVRRRV